MPGRTSPYALAVLITVGIATAATAEPLTLTHQGIERSAWLSDSETHHLSDDTHSPFVPAKAGTQRHK